MANIIFIECLRVLSTLLTMVPYLLVYQPPNEPDIITLYTLQMRKLSHQSQSHRPN